MYARASWLFLVALVGAGQSPTPLEAADGLTLVASGGRRAIDARVGDGIEVELRWNGRELPSGARTRWLELVPRPEHVDLEAPSPPYRTYTNAQLGGPHHGRWIGQDVIEGDVVPLAIGTSDETRWRWTPNARELGTRWLAAEITLPDGRVVKSATDIGRGGVTTRALRVSVRADDSFLGWLGSYFRVPYVFGSTPAQSESYRGIDCADVMVAAQRRVSGRALAYTSVQGLERHAVAVSEPFVLERDGTLRDGGTDGTRVPIVLRFGVDVRPGDLLAIDYADDPEGQLPRPWDHVGAVLEDRGPEVPGRRGQPPTGRADGILGADDLVRHMGLRGLVDEPLARHGHVRLRIWRWR
ncbi:MAG: hypothetical protein MUE69_29435 [Myxococcota bacterium]|jgi:hypothetical protein|nr:hypothetical protein [Myxococcota bacterium]